MARQRLEAQGMDDFERQMDRMVHALFPHEHRVRARLWRPATDVYETEDAAIVKVEVAGMNPDDFTISVINRTLIVRGVRQDVEEKQSFHRLEIPYGEFQIEVLLSGKYETNSIEAEYDRGFLYIRLPKSMQEHHVPVRVQSS